MHSRQKQLQHNSVLSGLSDQMKHMAFLSDTG